MQRSRQRGQNLQRKHRVQEPGEFREEPPWRGVHTWGEADTLGWAVRPVAVQ